MRYLQESSFIRKFEGCEKLNSIRKSDAKNHYSLDYLYGWPIPLESKAAYGPFNEPTADSLLSLRALNLVQITANHIL